MATETSRSPRSLTSVRPRSLRHDAHREDPSLAFALARLGEREGATPIGIFRSAPRPSASAELAAQLASAHESFGEESLAALLHSGDTWSVGA